MHSSCPILGTGSAERAAMNDHSDRDDQEREPGAYIGRKPESAIDTIPGGVRPDDERIAAHSTQSSGEGKEEARAQGRRDEWPAGHRDSEDASPEDQANVKG